MITTENTSGVISWTAPSNIALVKYWGKFGRQYPRNPSISFTLSNAATTTQIKYRVLDQTNGGPRLMFRFEGKEKPEFSNKISKYLNTIGDMLPIVNQLNLEIDSENTFPHSSGIASSASSMSALALCLMSIDARINQIEDIDFTKASNLARLGSGSASRSVFGPIAIWGQSSALPESSNNYAIPYVEGIDPIFYSYHDDILIISEKEKSVSSRAGHALMENNSYASARFEQADRHLSEIVSAMKSADMEKFISIVEREALTLHALMMASNPPYILMKANTLNAINMIQQFRNETGLAVCFTLDAGPNIHLLYPENIKNEVDTLKTELAKYCVDNRIIDDHLGNGPTQNK